MVRFYRKSFAVFLMLCLLAGNLAAAIPAGAAKITRYSDWTSVTSYYSDRTGEINGAGQPNDLIGAGFTTDKESGYIYVLWNAIIGNSGSLSNVTYGFTVGSKNGAISPIGTRVPVTEETRIYAYINNSSVVESVRVLNSSNSKTVAAASSQVPGGWSSEITYEGTTTKVAHVWVKIPFDAFNNLSGTAPIDPDGSRPLWAFSLNSGTSFRSSMADTVPDGITDNQGNFVDNGNYIDWNFSTGAGTPVLTTVPLITLNPSVNPSSVPLGSTTDFSVAVNNAGADTSLTNVTWTMPAGFTFDHMNAGDISAPPSVSGQTLTWNLSSSPVTVVKGQKQLNFSLKANTATVGTTYYSAGVFTLGGLTYQTGDTAAVTVIPARAVAVQADKPSGAVTSGTGITLTTATGGAAIRYTTDGSEPTADSPLYSGPIPISADTVIKAIAVKSGMTDSLVHTFTYTVKPEQAEAVQADIKEGPVAAGTPVTLTSPTIGAEIRYTTDGSEPTPGSTLYTGPIVITGDTTIKAVALKEGMTPSLSSAFTYTLAPPDQVLGVQADVPDGTVTLGTEVGLNTPTEGASIYYTTDGSEPTVSSAVYYTAPVPVTADLTIRAIAVKEGMTDSTVNAFSYTIAQVSPVVPDIPEGQVESGTGIQLGTETKGAEIRYTLDGSAPSGDSPLYSGPILITGDTSIKAVALKAGMKNSPVSIFVYTVKQPEADSAGVSGILYSATGGLVPGVPVKIEDARGTYLKSSVTDGSGRYSLSGLPAGELNLYVENSTRRLIEQDITLVQGMTAQQDLTMQDIADIGLTADPSSIVGDGHSTSTLTAALTYKEGGLPVQGAKVKFSAEAGTLSFTTATTGSSGSAQSVLTAPELNGIVSVTKNVEIVVHDLETGVFAEKTVVMTFRPAAITGVVKSKGQPVAGAVITIAEDFDGDGTTDFTAEYTTGADGAYSIVIPQGNWNYTLHIAAPVKVGDQTVIVHTEQSSPVGTLDGSGRSVQASPEISGNLFVLKEDGNGASALDTVFGSASVTGQLFDSSGSPLSQTVTVNPDGSYKVGSITPGTYQLVFQVESPDGGKLAGVSTTITVTQDGEIAVEPTLIDPYGIVSDASTGQPIPDINMKLYWADTALNRSKGRTPGAPVNLPVLDGFAPNQNRNPQITTADGQYAWMVYADGDYYIVADKTGYDTYDSRVEKRTVAALPGEDSYVQDGIIHVGQTIVNFDFAMNRVSATVSAPAVNGSVPGAPVEVTSSLVTDSGTLLQWEAPSGAQWYDIYQDGVRIASRVTGRHYQVSGLSPDTEYHFNVVAVNAFGSSVFSKELVIRTQTRDEQGSHQHYIYGYPDGTFKPERYVSRAEVAAALVRLKFGNNTPGVSTIGYSDMRPAQWSAKYVDTATKAGIVVGLSDGTFRPEQPVTRAEFAVIAVRFKGLSLLSGNAFADTYGHWGAKAVYTAVKAGFIGGYQDGTYRPDQYMTRAEFVSAVNRLTGRGPLGGNLPEPWSDVTPSYWAYRDIVEASQDHEFVIQDGSEILSQDKEQP